MAEVLSVETHPSSSNQIENDGNVNGATTGSLSDNAENDDENLNSSKDNSNNRLDYLLKQAEIFSHFVTNGSKAKKRKATTKIDRSDTKRKFTEHNDSSNMDIIVSDEVESVRMQFNETPDYIKGEMRDYQLRGLNWLISLYENGINGILADEMGLGKTLQTISMLGYLKHYERMRGPHLIVVPNSTLQNWINEIERFCPTLKTRKLIGDKVARKTILTEMNSKPRKWNICVTTYEMCLLEKGPLRKFAWSYIVIDEAHRIKNESSKLSQALRKFPSTNRLLLTGTPLQNNLHELWALLNYLLPDVFSSADDFDNWFDSDDCLRGNEDIVKRLHSILKPFMLRRVKSEVEKSLLPKIELKLFVGMTEFQRNAYKAILMKDITTILANKNTPQRQLNSILMELRKVANHPYLIRGLEPEPFATDERLMNNCGKMMLLDKLLVKLKAQGSRVLLFSQFVIMLDILNDYLEMRGYKFRRLDGNTPTEDRSKGISEFNAENSDVFIYLISTRAGGLGINLATADAVIIYDSDWNPQCDLQAIDRAHRIGQKKQVRVFRLVTENTIDERIVQRAEIKLRLDKMVVQQGRAIDENSNTLNAGSKKDMIRFGMKEILSSETPDIQDVDIEKILKEGATKTAEEKEKYDKLGENQLRNFTLDEASAVSVYQFEGVDFRSLQQKKDDDGLLAGGRARRAKKQRIALQEPTKYDSSDDSDAETRKKGKKETIQIHDFQFFPKQIYDHCDGDGKTIDISYDTKTKKTLLKKGFPDWSEDDFKLFCDGMVEFGRDDLNNITTKIPGKTLYNVQQYHKMFWLRGKKEIKNFDKIVKKIPPSQAELINRMINFSPPWLTPNKPKPQSMISNSGAINDRSQNLSFALPNGSPIGQKKPKSEKIELKTKFTASWMPSKPSTSTSVSSKQLIKPPSMGSITNGETTTSSSFKDKTQNTMSVAGNSMQLSGEEDQNLSGNGDSEAKKGLEVFKFDPSDNDSSSSTDVSGVSGFDSDSE